MPEPQLLTRGKIEGQAIGNGANVDLGYPLTPMPGAINAIDVSGDSTLIVMVDMTGTAVGDLAVQVNPIEADNATVDPQPLPTVQAPATNPALSGGHDFFYGQYDVSALEYVRVRITNNNAAPQTIARAGWRLA